MVFTHLARHCLLFWFLTIVKVQGDGIYLPVIEYRGQPCTDKTGCDYKILACVKTEESSRYCTKDNSLVVMAVDNFNSKHNSLKNAGENNSYPILYKSSEESSVRLQFCVTKDDIIVDEFELFVRNSGSSYHDCQIQNPEEIKRYILHSQMSKTDSSTLTVEVGLISEDCVEVSHNHDIVIPRRPRAIGCPPNKYGKDCSVYCKPEDTCDSGHYYCHPSLGTKICLMGWEGTECNTKVITDERDTNITCGDVNECRKGVCTNGTCCCNKGYSGVLCHSEILECESKPCLNGGTCKDGIGEFRCNCSPEYTGLQCETPIPSAVPLTTLGLDKCQSNHCQNNATCVFDEHLHVTYCVCPSGIIGDQCQNVQYLLTTTPSPTNCRANYYGDDCKIYCIPADSCDDGHYVCEPSEGNQVCRAGWKGKRCNVRVLPMEKDTECPDLGCKNDGVCFNRTCCCRSGFYGKNCENFDIGCSSHPCQNGGTCRDDNSSYSCLCLKGYTGKSCEKDIRDTLTTTINPSSTNTAASSITYPSSTISLVNNDSCLRTLCLNGGTCYLNATVATCKCPYEYTGSTCEIVSPTTPLGISSTVQAMTINNFTNGHTTIFPNKTIENQSLGLSSSTSTLLTVSIQPSKSSIVSYVSETVEVSTSTHLSNTSVLFNLSGLTTEGNTHELTITTTSSYEIKYATNVPSMDTSFGIKTSLSVFHDMSPSYSSHVAYLTSVSLNLESTSLEFSASTVKDLLATATEHYSSISSYETYKGLTTVSTSSAVNAVSPTKSSSTQIKVSSSFSPKRESSTSLNLVIQSTPSILTSINKNTISVNTLQTVSSTNMELQPSSSSIAEGTSIMTLYNKTSTFITSSKYLTHPQPPNSVAVTNTFPPSPSAGSTSIIMTTMIGGLNISITNLNKITTTPRQLVTSTTPKGENITKDTQPSVFYLSGRIHKTVSALKTLKALVQQALGSKGLLHWLDIRHFVDKQGHPFTQAQFNLTNGYLADEDFLKEIEKSVASSTSLQRAEASVFKGDTTDLIDLSKAHTINLVGYIYSKTDIEEAILNAWKTDTINPDIQIVDLEYCLGEYGIKLTRLSYLANSNGRQVMPWEISQDRRVQIAKVFESLDLNRLTSSAVSWPFANTFGLTVNQQHVTFKSSGTEETISSGWRRCLESNGTTCKEKCNVSVVLGRPERTIVDMRHEVSTINYYLKVNDEMIDPVFADDTVRQCGVCIIQQCHHYQGATVKKLTYIDTFGWLKLGMLNKIHPNISQSRMTRESLQETPYLLPDNAREEFIDTKSNTITRLWYLPEYRNDHMKGTWTNPASYGTMTSMEELLGRLNISVVRAPVAKLYRISLLHERQMSEFKNVVEKALLSIWISFHSLHSADSVKIQTVTWNVSYLSDNGTIVTVIGYRVSVLDADSSFSSLTEPQLSVVEEGLQKHGIASCSCTPHSRREIYVFGDILPDNFSDFQGAISDAWNETNKFFQGNISVKIIQGTTGFKSSDGKNATQLTYFVSALSGGIPVDERDLDEPSEETLNRYLNTTNSGVANLLQMKTPKDQDDFPWWFVVIGIVLCCALMLVTITVFSLIVRSKRYSKSRTLKQHPEDINAYDQEHFSSEPSFDIPTYNLGEPDVENDSVKAEIYIVNS